MFKIIFIQHKHYIITLYSLTGHGDCAPPKIIEIKYRKKKWNRVKISSFSGSECFILDLLQHLLASP